MNDEWASSQLREYIRLIDLHEANRGNGDARRQLAQQFDSLYTTVSKLVEDVMPKMGRQTFCTQLPNGNRVTQSARVITVQALGEYERREDRIANTRPQSPQLSADTLHEWVWLAAESLWKTGHHREAVQASATTVNANVQTMVGRRDVSDADLMNQAFSDKDPEAGKPRLRWPGDPADRSVISMNVGLRGFASGAFQTIRNAATHSTDEIPEQLALEQLAVLSQLSRWIQQCELRTV